MNRRELLQGALLTAAAAGAPAALAALPSDPLVSGVRYTCKHPDIYEYYTTGTLLGHPWGTKHPLSKFAAALQKHKEFSDTSDWTDFTWEVIP